MPASFTARLVALQLGGVARDAGVGHGWGMDAAHARWMDEALREAERAERAGEVPIGAVVVCDGRVVAAAANAPIALRDPTAHAEVLALRAAGAALGNYRLPGCALYVTVEPCAMCAGAAVLARVETLVYGCADPKAGAAGSVFDVARAPQLNHRMTVVGGVEETRARAVLQRFFAARR